MSKVIPIIENIKNVLDTMDKISQFVGDMSYDDFIEDDKTLFAVSKAIELIGETLKHFPETIKREYPGVPWQDIYGMRNFLAHNYFDSDKDEIWMTVNDDIPELRPIIEQILKKELEKKNYQE